MGKYFGIAFVFFLSICGYIIFSDKKEEIKVTKKDKNIQSVEQREIMTKNSKIFNEEKLKNDKKKVITEIETKINNKSSDIETIISQADKLIEDNNLDTSSINKASNQRIDKINKKYQELKKDLENLN